MFFNLTNSFKSYTAASVLTLSKPYDLMIHWLESIAAKVIYKYII